MTETRVIQQLNALAIDLIKSIRSDSSDPDALRGDTGDVARTLALLNVAMHDAVISAFRRPRGVSPPAMRGDFTEVSRTMAMMNAAPPESAAAPQRQSELPYQPILVDANPPRNASPPVLAASAGAEILKALFTEQKRKEKIDHVLESLVGKGRPPRGGEHAAISVGRSIAKRVLILRRNDVPAQPLPWEKREPGGFNRDWNSQYARMQPFVLEAPDKFRAPPPPALDSKAYFEAWDEVRRIGARESTERDNRGTEAAHAWNGGTHTSRPTGAWFEIAIAVADSQKLSLPRAARLFGLLGMTIADAMITSWDTKHEYFLWRPRQAIRKAAIDGNPQTQPDPDWEPLSGGMGGSPEYTSGTATFAAAGSTLLRAFFGRDAIPFVIDLQKDIPDTESRPRRYVSFSEAAEEAGKSRIYNGIHFAFANRQGMLAGEQVAKEVLAKHPAH